MLVSWPSRSLRTHRKHLGILIRYGGLRNPAILCHFQRLLKPAGSVLTSLTLPVTARTTCVWLKGNGRWVFSGDLYVGRELSVAGPETNVSDMLESINSLISVMDDKTILFTSLRTVRFDGRKTLMDFARHFEGLREQARKLASQGMSVPEIVNRLFGSESVFDSITDGLFSSANLVRAFLGD